MNTPAHVILNAVMLGRGPRSGLWQPITLGALLPDLPMFGFYLYQRLAAGAPEQLIWNQLYFESQWQAFFDVFNSIPLVALGALVAWRVGSQGWLALFLSMGLHCLADLPLHREDAHAHFFPFTSWHFVSPVSYWDPAFFGNIATRAELALVVAGAFILSRRSRPWRMLGLSTLAIYAVFGVFVLYFWIL